MIGVRADDLVLHLLIQLYWTILMLNEQNKTSDAVCPIEKRNSSSEL